MSRSPISTFLLPSRRQFTGGALAGGLIAASTLAGSAPALAQRIDVAVDKLMAPGPLPDVTIGNKDAKVTVVEYASMSCPHCANFHKLVLPRLKEKYITPGKVLLVMREFPLNQVALAVSMISRCAGDNDKIAALVEIYFEHQDKWLIRGDVVGKLFEFAKQAGFTREAFDKCIEDKALAQKLIEQRTIASDRFGVNATPSFFINGKALKGNVLNIDSFSDIIDPLLKQAS